MTKNDLTIISKPHAHPHTMKKAYAKFQNNRYKTVRGVALTSGFVCVEVLQPSQPNGVMSSAVSLPNHTFTGQA